MEYSLLGSRFSGEADAHSEEWAGEGSENAWVEDHFPLWVKLNVISVSFKFF